MPNRCSVPTCSARTWNRSSCPIVSIRSDVSWPIGPIQVGNSVVTDPEVHSKAFDWQAAFPEVFDGEAGGFDVVVGNPPYVRQELLSSIKPYLQSEYFAYHGMADLYVYFYELGLRVLKPGGLLSFVVTNKWMKSGYGEPLRKFFAEHAWIESVVDFGHAKQIFEQADVFPSIIVARRPTEDPKPSKARLCTIPREQLRIEDLSRQIDEEGCDLPLEQLGSEAWQMEPPAVTDLLRDIQQRGIPLSEYLAASPRRGILTGLNEAFLIEQATRDKLLSEDPKCGEIIKPYLRGQDIGRWFSDWNGLWMITLKSSGDCDWPWANSDDDPESVFTKTYPAVYAWLKSRESRLRKRQDQGRNWWELRACAYWEQFEEPKIVYQEIQFHPQYAFDRSGHFGNNKTFFVPASDLYLLAVLNSPLMWWHNWRYLPHMKDESLSPVGFLMESLPIAVPSDAIRCETEEAARRVIEITEDRHSVQRDILDWLRVEYDIEKPSKKLQSAIELDSDGLVAEVKKLRGRKRPLSAAGLCNLRDEHTRTIEPARRLAVESVSLETQISDLVNQAYGLTPEEMELLWDTAPPRMPIPRPKRSQST